jgi:flagellar basal body L-ring protein FlgH
MIRLRIALGALLLVLSLPGCGWIQTLRRDVEDDDSNAKTQAADYDYYKDPANRFVPPPPANASDPTTSQISGTPVDFSGTRAKRIRVTAADFIASNNKNENSLWSEDGQNNYLFARNKLKESGDLVTVVIDDTLRKDMVDSVKRLLPPEYRDQAIRVPGLTKDTGADRAVAGVAAAATNPAGAAEAAASNIAPEDMLTAEVLERYPNGNVRLRGIKRVPFKSQVRNIEVVAIVKGSDISEQDVVNSGKFFDQHVELYR